MLREKTTKFYDAEKHDLNCAETILYAANEEYGLNLDLNTLKTMAAFGGGMAVEGVCGAISGALAVLGILYTNESAHKTPELKAMTLEIINRFEETFGTLNCKELKQKYRNEEIRCSRMIDTTADILEDIINKYKYNKL